MPKVTADYFRKKKDQILDAAYAVCMRKPVYEVTMKDVVNESGLSQGGVYKYYSHIDQIFIDIINREKSDIDFKEAAEQIFRQEKTPEQILLDVFKFTEKEMLGQLVRYGKVYYDIGIIMVNDPERNKAYRSEIKDASDFDYLIEKTFEFIGGKVKDGYFHPLMPLHDIFMFIIASFDGIQRDVILTKCYPPTDMQSGITFDEKQLMKALAMSALHLLGGNRENYL